MFCKVLQYLVDIFMIVFFNVEQTPTSDSQQLVSKGTQCDPCISALASYTIQNSQFPCQASFENLRLLLQNIFDAMEVRALPDLATQLLANVNSPPPY